MTDASDQTGAAPGAAPIVAVQGVTVQGVTVRDLLAQTRLPGLRLQAGHTGLGRVIGDTEVVKPGLVLAGMQSAHQRAVHVLGTAEVEYLGVRGPEEQRRVIREYVRAGVPCVVLCRGLAPSRVILEVADAEGIPVFTTLQTPGQVMRALHAWLSEALAESVVVHGVLVQVLNVGVLITGQSGIGKSETALELITRGHRLVADDSVRLVCSDGRLEGMGREPIGHYMEIRGLGVLHAGDLFGEAAVIERARVDLQVELLDWQDAEEVDRTGLDDRTHTHLGVNLPLVEVPVRPGRPLATIVEVAARNHVLKSRGIHTARRFRDELEQHLEARVAAPAPERALTAPAADVPDERGQE